MEMLIIGLLIVGEAVHVVGIGGILEIFVLSPQSCSELKNVLKINLKK